MEASAEIAEPMKRALAAFRASGRVRDAVAAAGVHRATLWRWRQDPAVDAAWTAAYRAWAAERYAAYKAVDDARREAINAKWRLMRQRQAAYMRSCKRATKPQKT